MKMSAHQGTAGDRNRALVDEFELARMMLRYAVEKNIAVFSLSGLRVPRVLLNKVVGEPSESIADHAIEIGIFQEHLYDRIVSLADNIRMQREIWRFNEETRDFREYQLSRITDANEISDMSLKLMNALFERDLQLALRIIDSGFGWDLACAEAFAVDAG